MHPFIYPQAQLNRPDNIHNYRHIAQVHEHNTRHAAQRHLQIPNPFQYSTTRTPTHTMDTLTRDYSHIWNSMSLSICYSMPAT